MKFPLPLSPLISLQILGLISVGSVLAAEQLTKVIPTMHRPAEYRACHNFTSHQITGRVERVNIMKYSQLGVILNKSQYRLVNIYPSPSAIDVDEINYGDVITIGQDHSGIVGFYEKPAFQKLFCHFRGYTKWDASGKVVDRSDWHKISKKPDYHDHGIYCHTPREISFYTAYKKKKANLYRLNWIGQWKTVQVKVTMGGTTVEMPVSGTPIKIALKPNSLKQGTGKLTLKDIPANMPIPIEVNLNLTTPKLARFLSPKGASGDFRLISDNRMDVNIRVPEGDYIVEMRMQMERQDR